MPQIFKIGSYWVYFWSNENEPLEPIHVHISAKRPEKQATKVWITKAGKCLLANNDSHIPERTLNNMIRIIEARSQEIIQKWKKHFGEIRYYC
ncbi:MAG: DUF4160 domain-containing protein [Roseburia sp.]|nr:DUF4160 domain-containing protein [Roseburia sp.]